MRLSCICTGQDWRVRVCARDEAARDWFDAFYPPDWRDAAEWRRLPTHWALNEPGERPDRDRLIPEVRIHIALRPRTVFRAELGRLRLDLDPAPTESCPPGFRPARALETLELGARWITGVGRLGCSGPDYALQAFRTRAAAMVVEDAEAWIRKGVFPCPDPAVPEGAQMLFVAVVGSVGSLFLRPPDELFAYLKRFPECVADYGRFDVDREDGAVMVATATCSDEGASAPRR